MKLEELVGGMARALQEVYGAVHNSSARISAKMVTKKIPCFVFIEFARSFWVLEGYPAVGGCAKCVRVCVLCVAKGRQKVPPPPPLGLLSESATAFIL